jgi:signal transduction histidine kinase/ligand-binding sensor domain-containing protein/DNA-binding response OmpR family regulator
LKKACAVLILFLSFWLSRIPAVFADPPVHYAYRQLDSRSGLSNSSVNDLFQDSDNLLWVATWDGLNVYDGSGFHVFNYSKENITKSIGNNVILQIREDQKGFIWIVTIEGVSRYDKNTGKFSNYFYKTRQTNSVSEQEYKLAIDREGNVFCMTQKSGLMWYDVTNDRFVSRDLPGHEKINKLLFDENNHLWTLSKRGVLTCFQNESSGFVQTATFSNGDPVTNFFQVNHQILATTSAKQLFSIDAALQKKDLFALDNEVRDIGFYQDHYLLAWASRGYAVYDLAWKSSAFLDTELTPLKYMKVTSVAAGKDQILWFGTDGGGMVKIFKEKKNFGLISSLDKSGNSSIKQIRSFCEAEGNLWVGTKGNGIVMLEGFSASTGQHTGERIFQAPSSLNNNSVYALLKGNDNLLYIGSDGKGIGIYDLSAKRFFKWADISGAENYPSFSSVYSIIQDADHSVWLGTSGYGMIHLKLERAPDGNLKLSAFKQYSFDGKDSGPGNDIICFLAKGNNNRIWIGCRYGGLSVFDRTTQKFRTFKAYSYEGSLSHNDVLALYKDHKNRLWIGTSYGLNWINEADAFKNKVIFRKLTVDNGLPNNTIHTIQEAGNDHIWISTNKGLARINPTTLQIERFQETDGLQGNEFCDGAVWKSPNGFLLFGGVFGFNFFDPEKISGSTHQTNILMSDLQLGGKVYNENSLTLLRPGQRRETEYTLDPNYNYFDFNVKSINFQNGDKSEYAYFLEGYDKAWHYSGTTVKISYFNIEPGKYNLKIKWSNGEGKWTLETNVFQILVKPFFWRSWPAMLGYLVILLSGGYALYRYRQNKMEMKHRFDIERMLRIKEEEVHQEQISFFTNITHELQTPLTLINGSVERFFYRNNHVVEQPKENYFLSIVHQQSSRLTYLVNQLLDFRKAEAGHLDNHYSYLNISALLSGIGELFVPLCDRKNLDYAIEVDSGIVGWMDKDKLEKIVFNLLSNAFKHSGNDQKIIFSVYEDHKDRSLQLEVKNSGCELTHQQLSKIFDQFFVVDSGQHEKYSNGIGLAFTRQLVNLLKGDISVVNIDNWITFRTKLSLSHEPAEGDMTIVNPPLAHTPSYLLRSITASTEDQEQLTPKENNKRALIAELEENEKKSILIVEDEPAIRFLLKDLLEESYIVFEAENGRHAIELLKIITPNLIISDIMMPDINGLELCNKVKNSPDTCHIPFILLSARGSMEQKTEGYDAGADAYIPKPFDTMHLLVRVRKLLEYRQRLHDMFKKDGSTVSLEEKNLADGDKEFLDKLVKLIDKHIEDTELDGTFLEPLLAMSKMQLYRKLKSLSNMTPGEFIKHIRLQRTVQLLQTTQLTVSEIFYRSGFNNQSYFFREFKKRFHCSPNEYRSQQRIHA